MHESLLGQLCTKLTLIYSILPHTRGDHLKLICVSEIYCEGDTEFPGHSSLNGDIVLIEISAGEHKKKPIRTPTEDFAIDYLCGVEYTASLSAGVEVIDDRSQPSREASY